MLKKVIAPCVVLAAVAAVLYYPQWQHWLSYATGSYNTQGTAHNYNAFSGSLSDVGEYTVATGLIANVIVAWRVHTCHMYWWCWRPGCHALDGTPYKLCARHHPADVPTVSEAVRDFRARSYHSPAPASTPE
jgi:hypothetical protein